MKLQTSSKKEIKRIAIGTAASSAVMVAVLYLLSLVGIGSFEPGRIVVGAVLGSAIAVGNFVLLCLTVQSCVGMEDQKQMKAKFQFSYNLRLLAQAGWVVIVLLSPDIHAIAGAAPLLFPHGVILLLNARARTGPEDARS